MKVTLFNNEIAKAKEFAEARREDSRAKNLTNQRGLKQSIPDWLDDFSVMGELAAAKALGVEPIFEFGRFGQPDLYCNGFPIDVKTSVCKESFAVAPYQVKKMPEKSLILYVTGQAPQAGASSVTLDVIGVISTSRVVGQMPLSNFGNSSRPEAYKVSVNNLTPTEEFLQRTKNKANF